jgi:hypothetical protein
MHYKIDLHVIRGYDAPATNQIMKRKEHPKLNSTKRVAFRLREVSEMTGVPTSTLRTLVRRGELNPVTSFGVWLITAEELEAILKKRLRNHRESSPD